MDNFFKRFFRPSAGVADAVEPVSQEGSAQGAGNIGTGAGQLRQRGAEACPYCESKNFVKRGTRKNVHQVVQLYLCRNPDCGKTFTAQDVKGKHFPLNVVIEGMSYYNLGCTLEQTCLLLNKKFGVAPEPATLSESACL